MQKCVKLVKTNLQTVENAEEKHVKTKLQIVLVKVTSIPTIQIKKNVPKLTATTHVKLVMEEKKIIVKLAEAMKEN